MIFFAGYDWNFAAFGPYLRSIGYGAIETAHISFVAAFVGTALGFAGGAVIYFFPVPRLLLALNDAVRSLPVILIMFAAYYLPTLHLFGVPPPSARTCAIFGLGLSQAAFTADLVYSAARRVNQRTIRSARAIGLREHHIFTYLIVPDICRQILPALIAFWVGVIKWSSIASVISCQDIVYATTVAAGQTYRAFEAWIIVAAAYLVIIWPMTMLSRLVEETEWIQRR